MPLPPSLAARLAKRGIVSKAHERPKPQTKQNKPAATEEVEEVFAEDYDDLSASAAASETAQNQEEDGTYGTGQALVHETIGCPNKHNPHHKCSNFCRTRWGYKLFEADQKMEKRRHRMLRKYPLPENWQEVADPDTGRYYYWNTHTEEVSWLAPLHPKALISYSVERLQRVLAGATAMSEDEEEEEEKAELTDEDMEEDDDIDDLEGMEDTWREVLSERWEKEIRQVRQGEKDRRKEFKKGRGKKEELDPMDPAAYSDIPRGTWTTGLDLRGSAKTGVDVTASGPLFQQRPYPSPGAILRMNKQVPEDDD